MDGQNVPEGVLTKEIHALSFMCFHGPPMSTRFKDPQEVCSKNPCAACDAIYLYFISKSVPEVPEVGNETELRKPEDQKQPRPRMGLSPPQLPTSTFTLYLHTLPSHSTIKNAAFVRWPNSHYSSSCFFVLHFLVRSLTFKPMTRSWHPWRRCSALTRTER